MSEITKQKGASSSTPSPFMRWFSSKLMNFISSEKRQLNVRKKREAKRRNQGRKHVVEYFHQVDDDSPTLYQKPKWGKALKRERTGVPWIIISNDETWFEGPLPLTLEQTINLIKQHTPSK